MNLQSAAATIHKWLALLAALPLLFWLVSGFFFTIYPIERVRSEHRMAAIEPAPVDLARVLQPSALELPGAPSRVTLQQGLGGPHYLVEFPVGRPLLFDANDGAQLSPLTSEMATATALAHLNVTLPVQRVDYVIEASTEYRGALPAWRVSFVDPEGLVVYVAADTGAVTARRSDLWRAYDTLWAFHIMDWRNHENFNHGLIIGAALVSLIVYIAGLILLPYRLRLPRRRE
jgi:hypothetical protein